MQSVDELHTRFLADVFCGEGVKKSEFSRQEQPGSRATCHVNGTEIAILAQKGRVKLERAFSYVVRFEAGEKLASRVAHLTDMNLILALWGVPGTCFACCLWEFVKTRLLA